MFRLHDLCGRTGKRNKDDGVSDSVIGQEIVEFLFAERQHRAGGGRSGPCAGGARIHRQLKNSTEKKAKREVFLSLATQRGDFIYQIEGRADGILEENGSVTVDEIKATIRPMERITEAYSEVHWARPNAMPTFTL